MGRFRLKLLVTAFGSFYIWAVLTDSIKLAQILGHHGYAGQDAKTIEKRIKRRETPNTTCNAEVRYDKIQPLCSASES